MLWNLLAQLWNDEAGAVLSTEYLMLGTIVAAGGATGMTQLRDSVTDDFKAFGQNASEIRRSYMPPMASGTKVAPASAPMADYPVAGLPPGQQITQPQRSTFSMP